MSKPIKGIECKFAVHSPAKSANHPDYHIVKELVTYDDDTTEQRIVTLENFQRPYYLTKREHRNHKQKKEWEDISKLDMFMTTQSDLTFNIARKLGIKKKRTPTVRELGNNPYLYGAGLTSTAYIKHQYQTKYPGYDSAFTVGTFDTETDMLFGTEETIIATAALGDESVVFVNRWFLDGVASPNSQFENDVEKYIGKHLKQMPEFFIVNSEIDCFREMFKWFHVRKPDILSAWNIKYDIEKFLEACKRAKVKPEDIVSDPEIPKGARYFKFTEGRTKKITASKREIAINPSSQWHNVQATSSFFFLDAMATYKYVRLGEPEERSYSLDAILGKELKDIKKLKIPEADKYIDGEWHKFMQTHYKIAYCVYAAFDTISMIFLERKTRDLSLSVPVLSGIADFNEFNSLPKGQMCKFYQECLLHDKIVGTVPQPKGFDEQLSEEDLYEELDEEYGDEKPRGPDEPLSLKGWIVTLPENTQLDVGTCCIIEDDGHKTKIRGICIDADAISSYPFSTIAFNLSKETTCREIIDIHEIPEDTFRKQGINLVYGPVNAIEYCSVMMNFPDLDCLLEEFKNA